MNSIGCYVRVVLVLCIVGCLMAISTVSSAEVLALHQGASSPLDEGWDENPTFADEPLPPTFGPISESLDGQIFEAWEIDTLSNGDSATGGPDDTTDELSYSRRFSESDVADVRADGWSLSSMFRAVSVDPGTASGGVGGQVVHFVLDFFPEETHPNCLDDDDGTPCPGDSEAYGFTISADGDGSPVVRFRDPVPGVPHAISADEYHRVTVRDLDGNGIAEGMIDGVVVESDLEVELVRATSGTRFMTIFGDVGGGPGRSESDVHYSSVALARLRCGDGALEGLEQCDDGNTTPGDGCDESCQVEAFTCCDDSSITCNSDSACGAGTCCLSRCDSDGDDSNGCDGQGAACSGSVTADCTGGTPACCGPVCGNGFVEPGEECDDGDLVDGDGCSADCEAEGVCTGDGSACVEDSHCEPSNGTCCGNGVITPPEECDDGNLIPDDSCDNTCAACDDCPPACLGFQGPAAIQATVKKTLLKNKDGLKGTTEKWTTKGEFDLSSTQAASLNPATQPVQVLFRESDGVGGFSSLWPASPTILPGECSPAPSCWVLKGKTGKLKWNYKDKDETLNPGLQKGLIKQKFNEFQFKFKGNLAEIGEPQVNRGTSENPVYRVREDVIVGGICSSVLMDCIQKNTTYKCFPAIGP